VIGLVFVHPCHPSHAYVTSHDVLCCVVFCCVASRCVVLCCVVLCCVVLCCVCLHRVPTHPGSFTRHTLSACWRKWQRFALVVRVLRRMRDRVSVRALAGRVHRWRAFVAQRKRVRAKAVAVTAWRRTTRLRRYLAWWRHWTYGRHRAQRVVNLLFSRRRGFFFGRWRQYVAQRQHQRALYERGDRHACRRSLRKWLAFTKLSQRLQRVAHRWSRAIESSALARWKEFVVERQDLRNRMALAAEWCDSGLRGRYFASWAAWTKQHQAYGVLLRRAQVHHRLSVLARCVAQWQEWMTTQWLMGRADGHFAFTTWAKVLHAWARYAKDRRVQRARMARADQEYVIPVAVLPMLCGSRRGVGRRGAGGALNPVYPSMCAEPMSNVS